MICGLLLIACIDVASILTSSYGVFSPSAPWEAWLGHVRDRGDDGGVDVPAARRRGRAW